MRQTNRIEEQAAGWLAHLSRPSTGAEEHAAFDRWLAADPKHVAAYERLEAAWRRLNRLQSFGFQSNPSGNIQPFPFFPSRQKSALPPSLWKRLKATALKALRALKLSL